MWNFESSDPIAKKILESKNYFCLSCALSEAEYKKQSQLLRQNKNGDNQNLFSSYGVHPQNPDVKSLDFLQSVKDDIKAIGECGFDFYNSADRDNKENQIKVFESQIDCAVQLKKPLVIHARKANELLFTYSEKLKKVPAVIFHSFMGTPQDAKSFLNRGIKAYFTFGKQLLKTSKKACDCVKNLDLNCILLETDAPYQTLKEEKYTSLKDILNVYRAAMELRGIDFTEEEKVKEFTDFLYQNFLEALNIF